MMIKENKKLLFLESLERKQKTEAEVKTEQQKFFITFPYPYMNGKLHLGHLFTVSKAEFFSRYKKMQGYNVLFPFSFHCTGMPISASAQRLQEELNGKTVGTLTSQKKILESMNLEEIEKFTDPCHWIRTFPNLCIESLKNFNINVDWRRSFITTDLNPYYDSFISWQFNLLKKKNLMFFGKRYSIFCPVDNQPCLDHDRCKGENVLPKSVDLLKIEVEENIFCVPFADKIEKVVIGESTDFIIADLKKGKNFIFLDSAFLNLKYQIEEIKEIKKIKGSFFNGKEGRFKGRKIQLEVINNKLQYISKGQGDDNLKEQIEELDCIVNNKTTISLNETENILRYFEPEETVISRSGGVCVVSLLDQWFIDYSIESWREKARKCVMNLEGENEMLKEGVEWINKWACSRSFGLGTFLPWDKKYLIDSLSDSTIYMAFYTFKHFLFKDFEGKEQIFPFEKMNESVWNFIFSPILCDFDGEEENIMMNNFNQNEMEILRNCRESLKYFYPVDLRVSGKDLIKNHLIFYIMNHVALFKEEYWPKRIYTNGHLLLNSEKMSKSTGNFLSVDDCLKKYGVSATRMCLAVCGDGNEDANFIEAQANSFILRLYNLYEIIEGCHKKNLEFKNTIFIDLFLLEGVNYNLKMVEENYEKMLYSNVVKYGFYEMINLRDTYLSLGGEENATMNYLLKSICLSIYPIVPSFCEHLISTFFKDCKLEWPCLTLDTLDLIDKKEKEMIFRNVKSDSHLKGIDYLKKTVKNIKILKNKIKKKNLSKLFIGVGKEFQNWKKECMKEDGNIENINLILEKYNVDKKKGVLFAMDYFKNRENYICTFDEFYVLNEFKGYLEEKIGLEIKVEYDERGDPLNPFFNFE